MNGKEETSVTLSDNILHHPIGINLKSYHQDERYHYVVLHLSPSFNMHIDKYFRSHPVKKENMLACVTKRHKDSVYKFEKTYGREKCLTDDWYEFVGNDLKLTLPRLYTAEEEIEEFKHFRLPKILGGLISHYEAEILDTIKQHFTAKNLTELVKVVVESTPNKFCRNTIAAYSLYDNHPDELRRLNESLIEAGLRRCTLYKMGGNAFLAATNGKYLIRIIRKDCETVRPSAPQILQPVRIFETEHYRAEIMPKVLIDNVTYEHVIALKAALALGYQNDGVKISFDDAESKNVGLLADGTPLVIDPGYSRVVSTVEESGAYLRFLDEQRRILESVGKKYDWINPENGRWKQHIDFSEIVTGHLQNVYSNDYLRNLRRSPSRYDRLVPITATGHSRALPKYPNEMPMTVVAGGGGPTNLVTQKAALQQNKL